MHTTWKKLIAEAMQEQGETWEDVISTTLTPEELDEEFYDDYGTAEGCPFTLWTTKRVYFPAAYDGAEWVASVPRSPCDEKTRHVGGG
jgi:hypothetical protein